jgi:predicted nuclease of predicted toxin-antitoxin system
MRTSRRPSYARSWLTVSMHGTCGDRGLEGAADHELLDRAYAEDRILVTLNVGDFETLVRKRELHAGVVLIERAGLLRDEQIALMKKVAVALAEHGALINEVLRVAVDETLSFETLPTST